MVIRIRYLIPAPADFGKVQTVNDSGLMPAKGALLFKSLEVILQLSKVRGFCCGRLTPIGQLRLLDQVTDVALDVIETTVTVDS